MAEKIINLLLALEEADLDNQALLLLSLALQKKETQVFKPEYSKGRLDLESKSDDFCRFFFRFAKADIYRLRCLLGIPLYMKCPNGTAFNGIEGLCILLRRFSYPNRLSDLSEMFGRSKQELSFIFNRVLYMLYNTHRHRLEDFDQPWLSEENVAKLAQAVHDKGAPVNNIWGFIDGTVRAICRPQVNQRVVYNGHKRKHALKFQGIMAANGLIVNLFGPMEGKRHDCALLRESRVLTKLAERAMFKPNGDPYAIYGDPAYAISDHLMCPFKNNVTPEQAEFNKLMSSMRECVEWGFGKIIQEFAFLDFNKNLKLYLQPVGIYYIIGGLLANCHTCCYGSNTTTYFKMDRLPLEEYLG